jgi:hypothetical protein
MNDKRVTVCLASCNRFDLLEKTLDTFFGLNTYPIERFIITEDSTISEMKNKILSKYSDKIEFIFNETNLGPFVTFDNMYKSITTPFIFHCEDDWSFAGNANFMQHSMDILEENSNIHQIWIRKDIDWNWVETEVHSTKSNVNFRMMKNPHLGTWCGFSGNPGLRRKIDYDRIFPNGYAHFVTPKTWGGEIELRCNNHAASQGYRAATLLEPNTVCSHLGANRTTLKIEG